MDKRPVLRVTGERYPSFVPSIIMRLLYTLFALVVVCSAAVLADSQYTQAPVASSDSVETPAPVDPYETPAPPAEDAPAPVDSVDPYETTAPVVEETSAPVTQDPDASSEEETPVPTPAADPSNYRVHRHRRQADNITTATTARPLTTTSALSGISATEESGNATATCAANAVCFHDEDCGSTGDKKGRCLGFFNGKCNCNACLNFLSCSDDSACGGLKGACNTTTSRCSCDEGYKANGFAGGLLDAFRELCNVKDCNANNHAEQCFGLPCNSGRCIC
ncbi:hypothetical protein AAVH_05755 [Aphelenchoides avenae]|nr:hypothetical protein AAVH_05755 [Aphelenchus avenae]